MSRSSWRSAEALHKRRVRHKAVQRVDERARLKREQEIKEWQVTGEPAFQPKERRYPHGGGVEGAAGFLDSTERAIHLYDRYVRIFSTAVLRTGNLRLRAFCLATLEYASEVRRMQLDRCWGNSDSKMK